MEKLRAALQRIDKKCDLPVGLTEYQEIQDIARQALATSYLEAKDA